MGNERRVEGESEKWRGWLNAEPRLGTQEHPEHARATCNWVQSSWFSCEFLLESRKPSRTNDTITGIYQPAGDVGSRKSAFSETFLFEYIFSYETPEKQKVRFIRED